MHLLRSKKVNLGQYLENIKNSKSNYSRPQTTNDISSLRQSKDARSLDSQNVKKNQNTAFKPKNRFDQITKKNQQRYQYRQNDNASTQLSHSNYDNHNHYGNYPNSLNHTYTQASMYQQPLYTSRMMPHHYQHPQYTQYPQYTPYNRYIQSQVIPQPNFAQTERYMEHSYNHNQNENKSQNKKQSKPSLDDINTLKDNKSLDKKQLSPSSIEAKTKNKPIKTENKKKLQKHTKVQEKKKKEQIVKNRLKFFSGVALQTIYPTEEKPNILQKNIDLFTSTTSQTIYPYTKLSRYSEKEQKQIIKNLKIQLRNYVTEENIFGFRRAKVNNFLRKGMATLSMLYNLLDDKFQIQKDLEEINNWITSIQTNL